MLATQQQHGFFLELIIISIKESVDGYHFAN
jgi:hypothetical protein